MPGYERNGATALIWFAGSGYSWLAGLIMKFMLLLFVALVIGDSALAVAVYGKNEGFSCASFTGCTISQEPISSPPAGSIECPGEAVHTVTGTCNLFGEQVQCPANNPCYCCAPLRGAGGAYEE